LVINSKLFFTKSKDTLEDSYVYNRELYGMDILAELAELSACNMASEKIAKGEGIMSLGRGTKSLVLVNCEVPDETATVLIKILYIKGNISHTRYINTDFENKN